MSLQKVLDYVANNNDSDFGYAWEAAHRLTGEPPEDVLDAESGADFASVVEVGAEYIGFYDGHLFRGQSVAHIVQRVDRWYGLKFHAHRCMHCGTWNDNHTGVVDCEHCDQPTKRESPALDLTDWDEIRDDTDGSLYVHKRPLPTDSNKSHHSHLFLKVDSFKMQNEPRQWFASLRLACGAKLSKKAKEQIKSFFGTDELPKDKVCLSMLALEYGAYATCETVSSGSRDVAVAKVLKKAAAVQAVAGVYLDRPQNAFGSTGWDFIAGRFLEEFYE